MGMLKKLLWCCFFLVLAFPASSQQPESDRILSVISEINIARKQPDLKGFVELFAKDGDLRVGIETELVP